MAEAARRIDVLSTGPRFTAADVDALNARFADVPTIAMLRAVLREGLAMLNAPGTLDADYRGEVLVLAVNLGDVPLEIRRGERVAQLVIAPVARVSVRAVDAVDETPRGDGGFGSTGA